MFISELDWSYNLVDFFVVCVKNLKIMVEIEGKNLK